jgi:stage III sporulation protein AC
MDISLLFRVEGIGLLVAMTCQILSRSGREEQALLVTLTGMILVFVMLVKELGGLIESIRSLFGL